MCMYVCAHGCCTDELVALLNLLGFTELQDSHYSAHHTCTCTCICAPLLPDLHTVFVTSNILIVPDSRYCHVVPVLWLWLLMEWSLLLVSGCVCIIRDCSWCEGVSECTCNLSSCASSETLQLFVSHLRVLKGFDLMWKRQVRQSLGAPTWVKTAMWRLWDMTIVPPCYNAQHNTWNG